MPESSSSADPASVYGSRLSAGRAAVERYERLALRLSDARLVVFLVIAALFLGMLRWKVPAAGWLAIPGVLFFGLVVGSDAVRRRLEPARRRVAFYEAALARTKGQWAGQGEPGSQFAREDHPYDLDLDVFGPGSLFERLCVARTRAGQEALASWLLAPASPREVVGRQEAARELRDRLDLREDLAVLGEGVRKEVQPGSLVSWGEGSPLFLVGWLPPVLAVLSALNLAGLSWWVYSGQPLVFVMSALLSAGVAGLMKNRVHQVLEGISEKADELRVLAALLARIESEPFTARWLLDLRGGLEWGGEAPSRRIGRLARLASGLEYRRNQLFLPLALLLFWSSQIALAVERWRAKHGRNIAGWLDAVGRFEAIESLASYAFECPGDPFPELVEDGPPRFEATGLSHPLLPVDRCVRNDVALGGEDHARILLVTGSNMSGKSTMLRTVGINAVLAQAGAPVRAGSLRLSPLSIGATLRVQDSLQAGRSRFFAEIMRLRQVVDLSRGERPLLFLLDEILHGTNAHDRLVGAEALLRTLADAGAIGMVTTHDLGLAEVVGRLGVPAANVHFEDHLEAGQMRFDYKMRPGVVSKSNALELMRAIGLEV